MKKILSLLTVGVMLFSACSSGVDPDLANVTDSGSIEYIEAFGASVHDVSHDWGDISIERGDVVHSFPFRNNGDEDLVLKGAVTSCMCTTAEVILSDGSSSPVFGMHGNSDWNVSVAPGEEFEVLVTYDPMAHGPDGVGAIQRSVTLSTSADNLDEGSLRMSVLTDVFYEEEFEELMVEEELSYSDIEASDLALMLADKAFFLMDVHTPEQEHIEGTDAFIPYDDLSSYLDELPEDKDAEIVVYCRSGSMSATASAELVDMGYSNVKNVLGGINAYNAL